MNIFVLSLRYYSLLSIFKYHGFYPIKRNISRESLLNLSDLYMYVVLPGGAVVKNLPTRVGDKRDVGLILGSRRSLGGGNGNPLQYSCLKNSMDRGAWQVTVHGGAKSQIWLNIHMRSFSSVQFSHSVMSDSLWSHESQHARPPCPSPTPRVHPNSCPSSQWCHPAISSSVIPFSSCPPIPRSIRVFSNSQLFAWVPKYRSFSFIISPSKEHPGLISFRMDWLDLLQSKGLPRVFSNTTVQKHQFFSA